MDVPRGPQTPEQYNAAIMSWEKEWVEKRGDEYVCRKCGSTIMQTTAYVSIHSTEFPGCTGGGECQQLPLPYCPKCEGEPKVRSTCVHVPMLG